MSREGQIARRCRACGRLSRVAPPGVTCPRCGVPFGRLVLGLDTDPAAARAMESDRQRDNDAAYIRKMDETLRRAKPVDPQPAQAPQQQRPEETA